MNINSDIDSVFEQELDGPREIMLGDLQVHSKTKTPVIRALIQKSSKLPYKVQKIDIGNFNPQTVLREGSSGVVKHGSAHSSSPKKLTAPPQVRLA